MQLITRSEILPLGEYETIRAHFRSRVIEAKRIGRVKLGEHMSATFENRDTVMLQIQEMLRTERITNEPAIAHEIETYNELIPEADQLSFTLFIEIPERELRDRTLTELAGLETALQVEINGITYLAEQKLPAGHRSDRTTAVHYFKVNLDSSAATAVRERRARAALVIAHPRCDLRTELSPELLHRLAEELQS